MKARLLHDMRASPPDPRLANNIKPAGTVIDHPKAYMLVRMGCAEAVDDECRQRAGLSTQAEIAAQHAYRRLAAGIHPDDFAAYDAGYIAGYNPDGSFIPGPAATEAFDLDDDKEDFDLASESED